VRRILTSKRSEAALALCLVLAGCSGAGPLVTAVEAKNGKRAPDGVVLEPPPAMPVPVSRAEAKGVLALREPFGDEAIRDVVAVMLRAFEQEDMSALTSLLTDDAALMEMQGRPGGRQILLNQWKRKLDSFDMKRIAGVEVVRLDRIQRIERREDDDDDTPGPELRKDEVLVRVPIQTPRLGSDRIFGDYWLLLLRREDGRYKVKGFSEGEDR
jgi:hypothetical protein